MPSPNRADGYTDSLPEIADLERVGEWIIECEDAGELLARVERLCGTGAAGGGPSRG